MDDATRAVSPDPLELVTNASKSIKNAKVLVYDHG